MSKNFSGEQKLRIVLESIIRNISKSEQSKKYGVSEEEFQSWHDHLIQNGGKIFDSSSKVNSNSRRHKKSKNPFVKILFPFSLLLNLGLIVFGLIYSLNYKDKKDDRQQDDARFIDSPINLVESRSKVTEPLRKTVEDQNSDSLELMPENAREKPLPTNDDSADGIGNLLAKPKSLPKASLLPPAIITEPANEVNFMGKAYQGRHVVYLLDVGTYVLDDNETVGQFNASKESIISSIVSLSPNSYFNLVLYWNLREASALGRTILKASQENKKYATDWITSLSGDKESIKSERNQYYPKELLYANPASGIIGPWYGLSTAISYDPDLVFVVTGNLSNFDRSEVPRSHYEGLGKINFEKLQSSSEDILNITPLARETAKKWFYAITPIIALPASELEVEKIALARLGLESDNSKSNLYPSLSWNKAFENFLSSLEVGFDEIPQTHFIVNLPKYVRLPSSLENSVKEFSESSRGSFSQNILFP